MTCREVIEFLDAYRDRELEPTVRKRFDAHLAICPECIEYLESYETAVRLGRASGEVEPCPPAPASLVAAILAAIEGE